MPRLGKQQANGIHGLRWGVEVGQGQVKWEAHWQWHWWVKLLIKLGIEIMAAS